MCSADEAADGPTIVSMPLYDFRCAGCAEVFELQVAYGALPPCPACGHTETERVMSPFAGPFTVGMRGHAAKQSNAKRAVREEQRAQRKAARQEQRRQQG
jgi:putative FmdB family regulatory protein